MAFNKYLPLNFVVLKSVDIANKKIGQSYETNRSRMKIEYKIVC